MSEREHWGYVLRGHSDLNNYVFKDYAHAEKWISVPGARGRVRTATYKTRLCCGEPYGFRFGAIVLRPPKRKAPSADALLAAVDRARGGKPPVRLKGYA